MPRVHKPRAIIDRKVLMGELDDMASWSGVTAKTRPKVLALFKDALAAGAVEVRRRFEEEAVSGAETTRAQSYLIDQLVAALFEFTTRHVYPKANPTKGEQIAVAATGGYGRGMLAPHSDIDLLFLLPYKQTPHVEQVVEYMLYMLWDLGLKVGHATRSIEDNIKLAESDITIRTSLLDARWLFGNRSLFDAFRERYKSKVIQGSEQAFVDAKLGERDDRLERMGDTRYVLEPNIKEGKGGLRDLQTLFWIGKYLYGLDTVSGMVKAGVLTKSDGRRFAKADNFLWTVRCHLHYLAGRAEERLTFDVQATLAERMNYTDRPGASGVERFMKHYYLVAKDVGSLTRIVCAVLEDTQKKKKFRIPMFSLFSKPIDGFSVEGGRIDFEEGMDLRAKPLALLRLFHEAQANRLDIHPNALRRVTQNLKLVNRALRKDPEANRLFMEMLTSKNDPRTTLLRLNEAGVFGRFVPDFGRVVAQMQYDMYHVYTVDEHTIRAIGILAEIERGELAQDHPISTKVIHEVQSRRALYVAVLLHDIAKGRGGDHSVLGAEVAEKLCPRFGLNEWETETVSWLVGAHLTMSRTAFKRDVDDPQTAQDFAAVVQSPERLRLLLILTVVDIRAVGPGVWNNWKAVLLGDLYERTQEVLSGNVSEDKRTRRVARAKTALAEALADWDADAIQAYQALGYDSYWLMFDTETQVRHARFIRGAEDRNSGLHVETNVNPDRDITEILVYTPDHPGLFARIAGAMALGGASIQDAKIVTLANGMALDTFWIQDPDGTAYDDEGQLDRLRKRIEDVLEGRRSAGRDLETARSGMLRSRTDVFTVAPRVLVDNAASRNHTVIELNGRDRPGFLHDITNALTGLGLQIASAHISTYGERAVDVFYVKDVFGLKIEHDEKIKTIKAKLLEAILPPADEPKAAGRAANAAG